MSAEHRGATYAAWLPVLRVPLLILAAAIALLLLFAVADALVTGDRIHAGVTVAGIDVGRRTRKEAAALLEQRLDKVIDGPVRLTSGSHAWDIERASLSFQVDYPSTSKHAWEMSRSGSAFSLLRTRFLLWLHPSSSPVAAAFNRDAFDRLTKRIAALVEKRPADASLKMAGAKVVSTPARTGRALDRPAMVRAMIEAFTTSDREREVEVASLPVSITDEDVAAAGEKAALIVSRPLYLRYNTQKWRVSREAIARWIVFERRLKAASAPGISLEAELDKARVKATIAALTATTMVKPRDAVFKARGEDVIVLPSRIGAGIDTDRAYSAIRGVTSSLDYRLVRLFMSSIEPKITTGWAKASGITRQLATYTTSFDSGSDSRVNNIQLLASRLNNTFVKPGEVFSFNKTIGPRTAEKGYQEAPAIIGGELVPSIGGGVCQVATTMFNAVFFSGLDVVERRNHSFYISHYPDGRDATVSWGGPDFKFKNDTDKWVLIKTQWGDSFVTVSIYGGDVGNEVTFRTSEFRNYVDPPMKQIADPALQKGQSVVEDSGIRGRDITVWRVVRRNGALIHEDTFESHYEPKAGTERVGAKAPPTPPRGSREPSATPAR